MLLLLFSLVSLKKKKSFFSRVSKTVCGEDEIWGHCTANFQGSFTNNDAGVKAETCWLRLDSAGRKTCEWNPLHLQRGTTFLSRKINVAKNGDGRWSPRMKRKALGWFGTIWDDLGCPGLSPSRCGPKAEPCSGCGTAPLPPPSSGSRNVEMWSEKGSGARKKK